MIKLTVVDFLIVFVFCYLKSKCALVSDVNCNKVVECGVRQWNEDDPADRIINGKLADPGKWPWLVALFAGGKFKCTASLVSRKYVLTAGHCIRKNDTFEIVAGVVDHTSRKRIRLNTKRVVRHPGYVDLGLFAKDDIVIIELSKPLNFTQFVRPICLAKQFHETNKDKAYISGWGRIKWTKQNGTIPAEATTTVLHDAYAHLVEFNECKNAQHDPDNVDNKIHICAQGDNHTSVYHGDSGGPLMVNMSGMHRWTQVGITSGGNEEQKAIDDPRIFTRISTYCEWINYESNGEVNCV